MMLLEFRYFRIISLLKFYHITGCKKIYYIIEFHYITRIQLPDMEFCYIAGIPNILRIHLWNGIPLFNQA